MTSLLSGVNDTTLPQNPSVFRQVFALLHRDVTILFRGSAPWASLGFFLLAGCLSPLAFGSDTFLLAAMAPGLVWILAILAALIGMETLFQEELNDGSFNILRLATLPLPFVALTKISAYWLTLCLPLAVAAPIIIFLLGGSDDMAWIMTVSLLIGTPGLVMIGGTLAAICAGLRRGTGLVMFLALPFFAPALIFGTRIFSDGGLNDGALLFLGAFSLQAIAICPFLTAAALRQQME